MNRQKVVIVGLGLMGGSLAISLRKKYPRVHIIGLSRSQATLRKAKQKKIINEGFTDLKQAVVSTDWVIVCVPVDRTISYLKKIDLYAKPGTLVTDVGSTKAVIVEWADKFRFKNIKFVGSHPMVGSHNRGLMAAQPNLYEGGPCFVVRGKRTDPAAFKKVSQFWKNLKMKISITDPKAHDEAVASVSHLPHMVAALLVSCVDPKKMKYVGAGFKDTTRIVQGDPNLWNAIIWQNKNTLSKEMKKFKTQLDQLLKLLKKNQTTQLLKFLKETNKKRIKL